MEPWRRELYANELHHHGIKGMHWGVRRFQNTDGSLTAAGRKRKLSGRKLKAERKEAYKSKHAELDKKYGVDEAFDKAYAHDSAHDFLWDNPRLENFNDPVVAESQRNWERVEKLQSKSHREAEAFADKYIQGKYGQQGLDAIRKYDKSAARAFLKFFDLSD